MHSKNWWLETMPAGEPMSMPLYLDARIRQIKEQVTTRFRNSGYFLAARNPRPG